MLFNYINYNSSKSLSKNVNALKMNFDLNTNTNNKTFEIKKTKQYLDTTAKKEVIAYFNSLPECLTKCERAPDLFSFFWLQKVGRTDLWSLIKKNDFKNLPTTLVLSNKPQENQTTTIKKVEKFDIPMFMNIVKQKYKDLSKN